MRNTHRGTLIAVFLTALVIGCRVVPPVTYPMPPGVSASFEPDQLKTSKRFLQAFCSVLAERPFESDHWGECKKYVDMPTSLPPQSLSDEKLKDWALLLV